ncbi:unnamed protein product [Cuscuta epithymum]|uniref:Peptidase C1A papain C-terminal domain-containing protein n=1 Tax=Cuscuta epithymum TaxID=186058 RepID=A0AAV0EY95_9ASTE|nr:unnamed protein product [Cuscuta epithymum]
MRFGKNFHSSSPYLHYVCGAIAVASTIESLYNLQVEEVDKEAFSPQDFINCAYSTKGRGDDKKAQNVEIVPVKILSKLYKHARDEGLSRERECPFQNGIKFPCNKKKSPQLARLGNIFDGELTEEELLKLVAKHPVNAVVEMDYAFIKLKKDVIYKKDEIKKCEYESSKQSKKSKDKAKAPQNHSVLEHAIVVAGYGTKKGVNYWIIRNSYGTTWGDGGYGLLMRSSSSNNSSVFKNVSFAEIIVDNRKRKEPESTTLTNFWNSWFKRQGEKEMKMQKLR